MPTRKPAPGKPRAGLKAASLASNIVPRRVTTNGAKVYGTSALNGSRHRRTNAELEDIDDNICEIAEAEKPVTVRGLFYRVMSRDLVPKTEHGYAVVQRQSLKLRRSGDLRYSWITDGSRLRLRPTTYSSAEAALRHVAKSCRQSLWADQGVHVEVWAEAGG
jgi:hypothetical protein